MSYESGIRSELWTSDESAVPTDDTPRITMDSGGIQCVGPNGTIARLCHDGTFIVVTRADDGSTVVRVEPATS